jgi:WXG100 family type VII secretion target
MTIALDHEAFSTAIGDVQHAAIVLGEEREAIGREVATLLQGWTGIAAAAFGEGWAQWESGALDVLHGLVAMGRLLGAVHDDLSHRDAESQACLDHVAECINDRITARLG